MSAEEYREYIKKMVEQIESEEHLRKIYNKVHIFFVKDDCIIKKKDTKQKDIETIKSILQDTEPEKVALVKRFVLGYLG